MVNPGSGEARKITQTNGQVTGFDHLSDRAGFLYTRKNSLGGADIHQVNMDGTEDQVRVNCGKEDLRRSGRLKRRTDIRFFAQPQS